jgi:ADP-heptose:LPS heptosyltransferase
MFSFRYKGKGLFTQLDGNSKYYSKRWFNEQLTDGTYLRGLDFFFRNRMELTNPNKFILKGVRPEMDVMYVGKGMTMGRVFIGGQLFKADEWVKVPIDFNSWDAKGQDQFNVLGFKFKSPFMTNSDLQDVKDGDSILVLRRYGGMGDILMQSMIFPEIRKRFPNSKIIYAIPKNFHPLFENCTDIDEIQGTLGNDTALERLLVTGEYGFIGDVSTACAAYECKSIKARGFVDKERSDIWAEHLGIKLKKHKTCIRFLPEEIEKARDYLKPDGRSIVGIAPYSANIDRSYPYIQELIDGLRAKGMSPVLIHHHDLKYECEKLIGIDLRKLGAAISLMSLMISTDTGPLHYAGILGVPVIGIFGVTDSKVRLSYYNAVAIQGQCSKQEYPCWGGKSAFCKKGNGIASCMFIDPKEILNKTGEIRGFIKV